MYLLLASLILGVFRAVTYLSKKKKAERRRKDEKMKEEYSNVCHIKTQFTTTF